MTELTDDQVNRVLAEKVMGWRKKSWSKEANQHGTIHLVL